MVFLTKLLFVQIRKVPRKHMRNTFIDSLRLLVKAGNGGHGLPRYGGVGGQGGDIYAIATENYTLTDVLKEYPKKRVIGSHGKHSHKRFILAPSGEHLRFEVPAGCEIIRGDGRRMGEVNMAGEELLIAKGGVGGNPKNGFLGQEGQSNTFILDLKLIADVGLVGFPNAGKSTFLKAVSNAKPKIASYPFTTIRPNIGIIKFPDHRQISIADLPGLVEGAHANVGMGHKFLKHIERTKLLLVVVDINGFQLSPKHASWSCLDNIILLNKELDIYNKRLLDKPAMLIVNKMDTDGATVTYNQIRNDMSDLGKLAEKYPDHLRPDTPFQFEEILPLSIKYGGESINYLKLKLRELLDLHAGDPTNEPDYTTNMSCYQEIGPKLV